MKHNRILRSAAAFALSLALLSGCGGNSSQNGANEPDTAGSPAAAGEKEPEQRKPAEKETAPAPVIPETREPDSAPAPALEPEEIPAAQPEPALEPTPTPAPEPAQEPQPVPEPESVPEPEGESVRAGDTYTISVTLEGGSGRASVESPATLYYDAYGKCWATIVWSSPNFDYMKVDGQRYDPINTEGNSTFKIPIFALDTPLAVIADTVAMSEPHEVEYTLTIDSASMQDA